MTRALQAPSGRGPFRADQITPKSRYELYDGHPVYCAPTSGSGSRRVMTGAEVLGTDPAVDEAGIDTGYSPRRAALYAPDVAIGNVPDKPGWVKGVPPLAVEYAGVGQDEIALATKVSELLDSGTRYLWVVRHESSDGSPPYVEVHEPEREPRRVGLDGELTAPGVLQNPVPVRALLERNAAHDAVLTNLIQRKGYESFEQALRVHFEKGTEKGIEQGIQQGIERGAKLGLRVAIEALCEALDLPLDAERTKELESADRAALERRLTALRRERRWA